MVTVRRRSYTDMDQNRTDLISVELCNPFYRSADVDSKTTVIEMSPAAVIGFRQPSRLGSTPYNDRLPTVVECTPNVENRTPNDSRKGESKSTLPECEKQRDRKSVVATVDTSVRATVHRSGHRDTLQLDTASTRVAELCSREATSQNIFQRDGSTVTTANKNATRNEQSSKSQRSARMHRKKVKKCIFISYSPDAGFLEKKFIVESVRQLKENNLAEDIWFDKDEKLTDKPCWLSMRMEAMEKCRAAVMIVSDSYLACPVSMYESKALLERQSHDCHGVILYTVLYDLTDSAQIPKVFSRLLPRAVDLTREHGRKSLAEKSSIVVGSLVEELEKHASIHAPLAPSTPPDNNFTGHYQQTKIGNWCTNDLQEWLFHMGIKEFYQQSFAEMMVDGFLLMAITDYDMIHHLSIDSRAVRKKIMQAMLASLDREQKQADSWHLRARCQRARPSAVYLVYDPADVRLAQSLKQDLSKKNLQVLHHQKLGETKEQFIRMNAHQMATASTTLLLLTDAAVSSPFVFNEIIFSEWLGKRIVTAMFNNVWSNLRPSLKALLGDCQAVDFETKMYLESLAVLENHIKPKNNIPVVILEQAFVTKMTEGVQPLAVLASGTAAGTRCSHNAIDPVVFISYQWDAQSSAEQLRHLLETAGIACWVDTSPTAALTRGQSGVATRGGEGGPRHMKAARVVVSCITMKYVQSEGGARDLGLAEALAKPIVPVMLRFTQWPPEGAPPQLRRLLARYTPVDMSNEKMFRQNTAAFIDRLRRLVAARP